MPIYKELNINNKQVKCKYTYYTKHFLISFLFIKDKDSKQVLKKNSHPRIKSKNTHGTGCTFASAFTAYHLLTENYETAFNHAVSLLQELITASADKPIGSGNGPLLHHLHKDN